MENPCKQCPWRLSNQGKPHPNGFYTKANLRRLWNQIRRGGGVQSCHLTDPNHPDHLAAGCSPNAKVQECPGSVVLVLREIDKMATEGTINDESIFAYMERKDPGALTKTGVLYWLISRYMHGGVPVVGGPRLPNVNKEDPAIGYPLLTPKEKPL